MRAATALVAFALARSAWGTADPVALGPCGPIGRRYEVVEQPGSGLRLGGTPLERLGLVAFAGVTAHPVPFQVDERRGRKLALPEGREPTDDDRPGVLDGDDLIVFMACDAGAPVPAGTLEAAVPSVTAWREIRLEDPVTHAQAFVYLVASDTPPRTDRRYVAYDPGVDLVTTAAYRVGMVNALPNYLALAGGGTFGPNLLDGLRLRADATFKANLAHWTLNERQGRHELIAWNAGPVRVVRRSRHHVVIGLGIRLTAGTAHTSFYPEHVYGPGSLKLPFSPSLFFRDITAFGGADGRDLRGWTYHAPGVPRAGFPIDGGPSAAERAFDSTGRWFLLTEKRRAIMFVARTSENLAQVVPLHLIYRDDAERPYPPETEPGTVPLVGYEGRHVEQLAGGRYTFSIGIYMLAAYRECDAERLVAQLDAPLVTTPAAGGGALVQRGRPPATP